MIAFSLVFSFTGKVFLKTFFAQGEKKKLGKGNGIFLSFSGFQDLKKKNQRMGEIDFLIKEGVSNQNNAVTFSPLPKFSLDFFCYCLSTTLKRKRRTKRSKFGTGKGGKKTSRGKGENFLFFLLTWGIFLRST